MDSQGRRPLANRAELDGMLDKEGFEKSRFGKSSPYGKRSSYSETAKYMIGEFSAGWGTYRVFSIKMLRRY